MGYALQYNIQDGASPQLQAFVNGLTRRKGLHQVIANRVQEEIRAYVTDLARTRHSTAERLGAKPSGFLGKAAEKIARKRNAQSTEDAATVLINHPGLSRAFGDVTIEPGPGKKALTIPLIAQAYNRRARRVPGLFVLPKKESAGNDDRRNVLVQKQATGGLVAWYLLVPRVVQDQDRTLLPSDKQIQRSGLKGVADYVKLLRAKKGGRA